MNEKPQSGEIRFQPKFKILSSIFLLLCMILFVVLAVRTTEKIFCWVMFLACCLLFGYVVVIFWRYRFSYDSSTDMFSYQKGIQKEIRFPVSDVTEIHTRQEERYVKGGRTVYDILCIQTEEQQLEIIYHSDLDFYANTLDIEKLTAYISQRNL
ncbi:MAG: hypothetical protein IJ644_04030 [Oscillospiraceae bacterium]|nr:hypothetical protein [Oscillospiraceae bacterium]